MTPSLRSKISYWTRLWLPPLGLSVAALLIFGRRAEALALAEQFSLGLTISIVFSSLLKRSFFKRAQLGKTLLTLLVLLVASGFVERRLSVFTWRNPAKTGLIAAFQNSREDKTTNAGVRAWSVPAEAEALTLSFEARLLAGEITPDWMRSDANFRLTPLQEGGETFTRVETPVGPDPYLMRTFDLGEPVGGRTFKVELELRAPQPISAEGCRGVWLQAWYEGGDAKCLAVALDAEWKKFELVWTAPEAARSSVIRVILNDLDGVSYDVRRVKLYLDRQGVWQRLEPLVPQEAYIQFSWENASPELYSGTAFAPTRAWTRYTLTTTKPASAAGPLTATLHLGNDQGDAVLQTRHTALFSSASLDEPLRPAPIQARQSLLFSDPNLAGHTLVALGLVALSVTSTGWLSALIMGVTVGGVWLTGSRAAGLGALVGLPWLFLLGSSKRRVWILAGIAALGALFLSVFGLSSLGRLRFIGVDEVVSRPQIWRVALSAFWDHPWQGLGAGGFAANWAAHAQPDLLVTHAHNLWLQFASLYGLPSLVAILWLTGGFLVLAWRWGRWRGLALVVPVFVMNIFDTTFFYSGVLFPLLLGMNALRAEQTDALQATTPPGEAEKA